MRPGNNQIEEYKASKGGDGLRIREDLPRLIQQGFESLTPAEKDLLKWLGVFFRKPTPGKFMMRIRMPNGFTNADHLSSIAELSERLGNGTLDITTRQQIELRGYTLAGIPEIFEKLKGMNLRSLQTGMDNVRNLNGCPLAGITRNELFDASRSVLELDRIIIGENGNPEFTNLPRKFNVTVTGCVENCTHAESQDIALVPATKIIDGTNRSGFHILVGGKMGSGGFSIASNLGWFIEPKDAVEVVVEIVKLFRDEGPRNARTKCRFYFLLQEWGLDLFRSEMVSRLGWQPQPAGRDARLAHQADHLGVQPQKQPNLYSVGLSVTVGRISHASLREMGRLAKEYGTGDIRLTTGQNAILINVPQGRLDALLREPLLKELPPEPSRFIRGLVSCTGIQYCNLAVIETKTRAVELAKALERQLGTEGKPLTIHWSGCPAACGNHLAADIGLRGMKVNVGSRAIDAVAVYIGGRTGPDAKAGQPIMEMVPCDEALPDVLATVVKHLDLFKQVEPLKGVDKNRILMVPADSFGPTPAGAAISQKPEFQFLKNSAVETPIAMISENGGKVRICSHSDLREGNARWVSVQGRSMALFLIQGEIFAIDAECPHEGGPLQDGRIEAGCVICPWHDYKFELSSGRCITESSLKIRRYPVSVEEGQIFIEMNE